MRVLRKLLFPFSAVYYGITLTRNFLYNNDILKSKSYDVPVICIGNLSVGGTGKSPMTEYVTRLLVEQYRVATLSRGYGRTTKGYREVSSDDIAKEVGDEPLQFARKFPEIQVAVCEDRQTGIERLLNKASAPEVIILDDAFQHRKVDPGFSIVLSVFNDLFIDDYLLPVGNLREPRSGVNRADAIVVTKCPDTITEAQKVRTVTKIKKVTDLPIFFSYIDYAAHIEGVGKSLPIQQRLQGEQFTLVTGIANPKPLVGHLTSLGLDFEHLKYGDHHNFALSEIETLSTKKTILTTEKDYVRLQHLLKDVDVYYLPIVSVIENSDQLDGLITKYLNK